MVAVMRKTEREALKDESRFRREKWDLLRAKAKALRSVGLSQPAIAKRLGIGQTTVSRWLRGADRCS
jgi:DNA-binding transcriptional regulator YiaG